jgi:hypothetical protein
VLLDVGGFANNASKPGLTHVSIPHGTCLWKVWVAPGSGIVLCSDTNFADQFASDSCDMVGRTFASLGTDTVLLER